MLNNKTNPMKQLILYLFLLFPTQAFSAPSITVAYDNSSDGYLKVVFGILMIIFTIFSFLIWRKYGKDDVVIPVVNFHTPFNLNPAEAEFAYKGFVTEKSIPAMLLYLAGKGYIEIKEEKNTFSVKKIKDIFLAGNSIDKQFLNAINPFDYSFVTKEEIRSSYIFYDTCRQIIKDLNNKRSLIFHKDSINIVLISLMVFFTITIALLTFLFGFYFSKPDTNGIILGLICTTISTICTYHLPKRNNAGLKLLGGLLGLKHFIESAQKHELELLVRKNPNCFYDVLPFAYILDVSDKWINKFSEISVMDQKLLSGNKLYSTSNLIWINAFLDYINKIK